jgi:hypothetical protein
MVDRIHMDGDDGGVWRNTTRAEYVILATARNPG